MAMSVGFNLVQRAHAAFQRDAAQPPPLTLRGGNDIDGYDHAAPYDAALDQPTDDYLERFTFWGLGYLDAQSWRHYAPLLIAYTLRQPADPRMVIEAFIRSLRPPDRYPPRLAALTEEQEAVVRGFLEAVAFGSFAPELREDAQQALEEWWWPQPRARPTPEEIAALRAGPVTYRRVDDDVYQLSVPQSLIDSGARDIPEESRRVRTWGGYLCGDVHAVVAVNVTPVDARSLRDSIEARQGLFRERPRSTPVALPGASQAFRLDGIAVGDSPAEPQPLTVVVAEVGAELVTLSIRTHDREDVRRIVEFIIGSLAVGRADGRR
jgi:uncharacterized protein DUF6714